jgi:CxxC-x17-CxxC domain-containing protein
VNSLSFLPEVESELEQKLGKKMARNALKALLKKIDVKKCNGDFSQIRSILGNLGFSENETAEAIEILHYGGCCDCEVVFNVLLYSPRPRSLHKAICSTCGNECYVPFKPDPDRPVYCRECFTMRKYCDRAKELKLKRRFRERLATREEEKRRMRR